jgi:hypothetical protein
VGAIEGRAAAASGLRLALAGDLLDDGNRAATDTNAGIVEAGDLLSEEQRAANRPRYGPGEEPRPREGEPTASAHGELL